MFYILLKNQWVEHFPDYLGEDSERARLESTLPSGHAMNVKAQRFYIKNGQPVVIVADLMSSNVLHVSSQTPLVVCRHIMETEGVHHLAVFDNGHFSGLISDRDILAISSKLEAKKMVANSITTTVVMGVDQSTTVGQVGRVFLQEGINAMPVLDEEMGIIGIITTRDLLRFLTTTFS